MKKPAKKTKRRRRKKNPELLTIAGNPAERFDAAARAYRTFHGVEPKKARRIGKGKGVLIALGDVGEIVYKTRRGDRKGPAWWHRFKRGAVLAGSPDGKHLCIIDTTGKTQLVDWERGIIR